MLFSILICLEYWLKSHLINVKIIRVENPVSCTRTETWTSCLERSSTVVSTTFEIGITQIWNLSWYGLSFCSPSCKHIFSFFFLLIKRHLKWTLIFIRIPFLSIVFLKDTSLIRRHMNNTISELNARYNKLFGSLFRSGLKLSFFGMQVQRYADLYTCIKLLFFWIKSLLINWLFIELMIDSLFSFSGLLQFIELSNVLLLLTNCFIDATWKCWRNLIKNNFCSFFLLRNKG